MKPSDIIVPLVALAVVVPVLLWSMQGGTSRERWLLALIIVGGCINWGIVIVMTHQERKSWERFNDKWRNRTE